MASTISNQPDRATQSFAIVGGGKVGIALGKHLSAAGYPATGVYCRTEASAANAAALIGLRTFADKPWKITAGAKIVFITTPDSAIASTCRDIAENNGFSHGAVVLHCSGALPSTILAIPDGLDIVRGSFHPLQSFATNRTVGNPFQGIVAAVEGDSRAVATAQAIGQALGAACLTIKTEAKCLYHAAAVVASNYLVTLIDAAFTLLEIAGINRHDAHTILSPLLKGTMVNIEQAGIPEALTGPISRGDTATIAAHMESINNQAGHLLPLYNLLGRFTITIALAKGTITRAEAEKLELLLLAQPETTAR